MGPVNGIIMAILPNEAVDCFSRNSIDSEFPLITLNDIKQCQGFGAECRAMKRAITTKMYKKPTNVSESLWQIRNQIVVEDDCLMNKD